MKSLKAYILELNLTPGERNTFSQEVLKGSTFDKHFFNLSAENLLKLKAIYTKKKKQCSLIESKLHCDYVLKTVENAINQKNKI